MASPAAHDLVCALAEPSLPPELKSKIIQRILEAASIAITKSNDSESNEVVQWLQLVKDHYAHCSVPRSRVRTVPPWLRAVFS